MSIIETAAQQAGIDAETVRIKNAPTSEAAGRPVLVQVCLRAAPAGRPSGRPN